MGRDERRRLRPPKSSNRDDLGHLSRQTGTTQATKVVKPGRLRPPKSSNWDLTDPQNPPKFACKDQSVALYGQLTFSLTRISLPVCLEITFWHQDIEGWAGQAHLVMLSPRTFYVMFSQLLSWTRQRLDFGVQPQVFGHEELFKTIFTNLLLTRRPRTARKLLYMGIVPPSH